jgi:TatD DNase family protein
MEARSPASVAGLRCGIRQAARSASTSPRAADAARAANATRVVGPPAGTIRGVRLIDSHCHLNADRFDADVDLVVGGARLAGVERILVPGWNVASGERALAVVERYPWMDAAVGVHPHDAAKVDDAGWGTITDWADDPRVVAIGETGLDFDRVFSPIPDQLTNLRRNLRLALDTGKPAILHCRSADGARDAQDTLVDELRAAGIGGPTWAAAFADRAPAIVHSFSGPSDYARIVVDLGLAISFSGLVFRRGEEAAALAAAITSPDRLLVETDSPFLSPPGAPRKRNEPEWVAVTARWLAEQRGATLESLGADLVASYDRTLPSQRRPS